VNAYRFEAASHVYRSRATRDGQTATKDVISVTIEAHTQILVPSSSKDATGCFVKSYMLN
jgi:hypothetical protein